MIRPIGTRAGAFGPARPGRIAARGLLAGALALAAATAHAQTAQTPITYRVTDLGALPGAVTSIATGINARGQVVGYCYPTVENWNEQAFVWDSGQMRPLGTLSGGNCSMANAINVFGAVCGDGDTGNFRPQSWTTTPKGMVNIFPNNGGNTHAVAINDSGAICGYYTKSLSGKTSSWKCAIWTVDPKDPRKYNMVNLPVLVGNDPTLAAAFTYGFNNAGQAVGYLMNDVVGQHAAFWNNDAAHTIVDLGALPGRFSSIASAINDLGQATGHAYYGYDDLPVFWDNDAKRTATVLPLLPGDAVGSAGPINNFGQILGYTAPTTNGPFHLVIWQNGQVTDLQTLLDPASGAGWTVTMVAGINDAGQIAATGARAGVAHALLLTPM